ncbi:MAG: hypothetical protein HQK87_09255 [Nitrospinae bacterium]|nr:hypothetical protein [Nitrospinota bacterium]
MATIPGVGPEGSPPVNRTPPPRPEGTDQLRQFTEREPAPPPPPPEPQDRVELSTQAAPPPPPPPPAEEAPPPPPAPEPTPTASQAATGDAQTTANYNERNPTAPVAEQEIGGTVNVKI